MKLLHIFGSRKTLVEKTASDLNDSRELLAKYIESCNSKCQLWIATFRAHGETYLRSWVPEDKKIEALSKIKAMISEEVGTISHEIREEKKLLTDLESLCSNEEIKMASDYYFALSYEYDVDNDIFRLLKKLYTIVLAQLEILNILIEKPNAQHKYFLYFDQLIQNEGKIVNAINELLKSSRQSPKIIQSVKKVLFEGYAPSKGQERGVKRPIIEDYKAGHKIWSYILSNKLESIIDNDGELRKLILSFYPNTSERKRTVLMAVIRHLHDTSG